MLTLDLNEVQVAAVFGEQTGELLGQVGDSLRIQYFYLANQIDVGVNRSNYYFDGVKRFWLKFTLIQSQ